MKFTNLCAMPDFLNPPLTPPAVTHVRRVNPGTAGAQGNAALLSPQALALLERLAGEDEQLAGYLAAWGGMPMPEQTPLAA